MEKERSSLCKIRKEKIDLNHFIYLLNLKNEMCFYKANQTFKDDCKKNNGYNSSSISKLENEINECSNNYSEIMKKIKSEYNSINSKYSVCLVKCTDSLNTPSEELTCYEDCENNFYLRLKKLNEIFYK